MVQHTASQFDLFIPPASVAASSVRPRDRVAVEGCVTALDVHRWAGGVPALHVTITDDTGSFTGAFLGRTRIAGVGLGETIILGGAVMHRAGRPIMMNPHLWFTAGSHDAAPESRAPALAYA